VEVSGFEADCTHLHLDEENERYGVVEGASWDLAFDCEVVMDKLGELGCRLPKPSEKPDYLIRVLVHAMGTTQGKIFFGIPPVLRVIIPFALPQLTLDRELDQVAHVRLHLDVYEIPTGRFVRSTPWTFGGAYYIRYMTFFFFTFRTTDLIQPP